MCSTDQIETPRFDKISSARNDKHIFRISFFFSLAASARRRFSIIEMAESEVKHLQIPIVSK